MTHHPCRVEKWAGSVRGDDARVLRKGELPRRAQCGLPPLVMVACAGIHLCLCVLKVPWGIDILNGKD